jgi:ethanolamine ammonia-lyase large subunit
MKGEKTMNKIMHYFVCILSVIAFASCASTPIAPIEDRSMQKVHDIDLTKNEIYDISLEWMARTFFDNKEVIEIKDKDNGKIIGKGITTFKGKIGWFSANIPCRFTLIVEAKDNKYRTTYNNLVGLYGENQTRPEPLEQKEYVDAVMAKLAVIDDGLYSYLKKSKSNTDW